MGVHFIVILDRFEEKPQWNSDDFNKRNNIFWITTELVYKTKH